MHFTEAGVDEFLDSTKTKQCIVIGIDHGGGKRINEYCPYDMERFGKGEGDKYVEFRNSSTPHSPEKDVASSKTFCPSCI